MSHSPNNKSANESLNSLVEAITILRENDFIGLDSTSASTSKMTLIIDTNSKNQMNSDRENHNVTNQSSFSTSNKNVADCLISKALPCSTSTILLVSGNEKSATSESIPVIGLAEETLSLLFYNSNVEIQHESRELQSSSNYKTQSFESSVLQEINTETQAQEDKQENSGRESTRRIISRPLRFQHSSDWSSASADENPSDEDYCPLSSKTQIKKRTTTKKKGFQKTKPESIIEVCLKEAGSRSENTTSNQPQPISKSASNPPQVEKNVKCQSPENQFVAEIKDEKCRKNSAQNSPHEKNPEVADTVQENMTADKNKLSKHYLCNTCGKDFRSKDRLERHMNHHLGIKPFPCDICKQGFSSALALREHKAARHDKQNLYECQMCGRGFKQSSAMLRHQRTHSKDAPHECNICKRCFSLPSYLRSHMLSHTGERKHLCSVCGKMFIHLSDLNRHKLVHTGKKPYKCKTCGISFGDRSSCKRHEKNHAAQKHPCSLCNLAFKCDLSLKSHFLKKHNNTNPCALQNNCDKQGSNTNILCNSDCNNSLNYNTSNQESGKSVGITCDLGAMCEVDTNVCSQNLNQPIETCSSTVILQHVPNRVTHQLHPYNGSAVNFQNQNCLSTMQGDTELLNKNPCHPSEEANAAIQSAVNENTSHLLDMNGAPFRELTSMEPDFIRHPNFESQEYYNWLSSFTSLCKLQSLPLENEHFKKINQVHKSITDALALPSGVLANVDNYKILLSIAHDLQKIIDAHISNILNQLHS